MKKEVTIFEQHCYKDMPELNDKEDIEIIARCREPFVTGKISWQEPAHSSTPDISTLFQNYWNERD